jgi:hypothetical protein
MVQCRSTGRTLTDRRMHLNVYIAWCTPNNGLRPAKLAPYRCALSFSMLCTCHVCPTYIPASPSFLLLIITLSPSYYLGLPLPPYYSRLAQSSPKKRIPTPQPFGLSSCRRRSEECERRCHMPSLLNNQRPKISNA